MHRTPLLSIGLLACGWDDHGAATYRVALAQETLAELGSVIDQHLESASEPTAEADDSPVTGDREQGYAEGTDRLVRTLHARLTEVYKCRSTWRTYFDVGGSRAALLDLDIELHDHQRGVSANATATPWEEPRHATRIREILDRLTIEVTRLEHSAPDYWCPHVHMADPEA